MHDGSSLPQELDACHQLIQQLSSEREQLASQLEQRARDLESREAFVHEQSRTVVDLAESREKLSQENEELKLTVRKLMDRLYGRRSERFIIDPDQLLLDRCHSAF